MKPSVICDGCQTETHRPRLGKCVKCYNAAYYQAHRQAMIQASKDWRDTHREQWRAGRRLIARRRRQRMTPAERRSLDQRNEAKRSEASLERKRRYLRSYYETHKADEHRRDLAQAAKQNRRNRERRGRGITLAEWTSIKTRQNGACVYCGRPSKRLTMDHVIPLVRGGLHQASNIVGACQPCNRAKGTKLLSEL